MHGLVLVGIYRGVASYEFSKDGKSYMQKVLQIEVQKDNGSLVLEKVKVGKKSSFPYEDLRLNELVQLPIYLFCNVSSKTNKVYQNYYLR